MKVRKLISICLVLAMLLGLGTVVFAADGTTAIIS